MIVLQRFLQHPVFAKVDAKLVEQVLVLWLKRGFKFYQPLKNILRLGVVAALKVGKPDAKVGPYVFFVNLERPCVFIFRSKGFALFAVRVAAFDVALHLLHFGKDGVEVKLGLGRKFGNQLVQGDLALGAAGHIVGVERLAVDFLAVLFNKPKGLLHCFARRGAGADAANLLGGKDPPNVSLAVGGMRVIWRLTCHAVPQYCCYMRAEAISAVICRAMPSGSGAAVMGLPTTR